MNRSIWIALILTIALTTRVSALSIEFSPAKVTVRATAGATVALLGVAREPSYYMMRLVSYSELLADDDRDGVVHYALANDVALSSIWAAVDVRTGEYAVAGPPGSRPLPFQRRGAGRGEAVEAVPGTLDVGRSAIDAMVVRPGAGAWWAAARDGSVADRDGQPNGRLRLDLDAFRPGRGGTGRAPEALQGVTSWS